MVKLNNDYWLAWGLVIVIGKVNNDYWLAWELVIVIGKVNNDYWLAWGLVGWFDFVLLIHEL